MLPRQIYYTDAGSVPTVHIGLKDSIILSSRCFVADNALVHALVTFHAWSDCGEREHSVLLTFCWSGNFKPNLLIWHVCEWFV